LRTAFDNQTTAQRGGLFADGAQADSGGDIGRGGEQARGVEANAIVGNGEDQVAIGGGQLYSDGGGAGMAREVGQRLLHGAINKNLGFQLRLRSQGLEVERGFIPLGDAAEIP